MKKLYFTITGTHHHYGKEFIESGMEVKLVEEPDNEFDKEAIKVEMEGLSKIDYVASGIVKFVLPQGIEYEIEEKAPRCKSKKR